MNDYINNYNENKNNKNVRHKIPLVHCITNYVTVNDVANALLACGASPIMADNLSEASEITSVSDALVINIGTLNEHTISSMIIAGKHANIKGVPIILDPVGVGISTLRNNTIKTLMDEINFAVVRGNLSEMSFIAGLDSSMRGVDSSEFDKENDSVFIATQIAERFDTISVITGAVDVVTDGFRIAKISNGVPMMAKITGSGCMLSGILGAYVGVNNDDFEAVVAAVASMGIAGEMAYDFTAPAHGTGSFHYALIDALSMISDDTISERIKVSYED